MTNLTHLTKEELLSELAKLGEPSFRAKQIWNWIYARGVKSFDEMTNIKKELRITLTQNFSLERPRISKDFISLDGTRKFLVKFPDDRDGHRRTRQW